MVFIYANLLSWLADTLSLGLLSGAGFEADVWIVHSWELCSEAVDWLAPCWGARLVVCASCCWVTSVVSDWVVFCCGGLQVGGDWRLSRSGAGSVLEVSEVLSWGNVLSGNCSILSWGAQSLTEDWNVSVRHWWITVAFWLAVFEKGNQDASC